MIYIYTSRKEHGHARTNEMDKRRFARCTTMSSVIHIQAQQGYTASVSAAQHTTLLGQN